MTPLGWLGRKTSTQQQDLCYFLWRLHRAQKLPICTLSILTKSWENCVDPDHADTTKCGRWLGLAKMSCILCHQGVQLILAYSWARPAILVAGRVEGECFYFFCLYTFSPVPLSSLFLSFISSTVSSISLHPFSGRRHKMTHGVDVSLNPNTIKNHKIWHLIRGLCCLPLIQQYLHMR